MPIRGIVGFSASICRYGLRKIDRDPLRPLSVEAEPGAASLLVQLRPVEPGIADPGGAAHAEEQRVGPADDADAIDVVTVGVDQGRKSVPRLGDPGETTTACRVGIAKYPEARSARIEVQIRLDVARIQQHLLEVRRAEVPHQFGRIHGDLRGDIAQLHPGAAAGQRARGDVATVGGGADHERRQFDGFVRGHRGHRGYIRRG
ncbi:MAG: hypothetical protein Q7S40_17325 [Opitutaceae bacterium]|nr:hypothetical protein [Opitutaceae bacterium]